MRQKLDHIDARLLEALQGDSSLSQRALAEKVGLSQNACWRRLKAIIDRGLVRSYSVKLNADAVGLGVTVFVMVRTRHHTREWLENFRKQVSLIPEVIDFYRIAGDYDYMIKVVTRDIESYDRIYQRLIDRLELDTVTSYFAMEAIEDQRPLPVAPSA